MATLVQVARAIEEEAVRRYALLAELMGDRGEPSVAAAFRLMREEEESHVAAVDRWAASVGDPAPPAMDYSWLLPADLSSSWEEVAGSALLTPYRAFALAVENEERAFSFYAYLAARAEGFSILLRVLYPVTPHITWTLWRDLGFATRHGDLLDAPWPAVDKNALQRDTVELVLQINGKLRGNITVPADADQAAIEQVALASEAFARFGQDGSVRKTIVVPGRLVNVVVK